MTSENGGGTTGGRAGVLRRQLRGIVVSEGGEEGRKELAARPKISAFVWGNRVRPAPTLPFGRWGGSA